MLLSKYKETATNYEEIITKLKLEVFNLMSGNSDLKEKIEVHHHNEKKYQEDREVSPVRLNRKFSTYRQKVSLSVN